MNEIINEIVNKNKNVLKLFKEGVALYYGVDPKLMDDLTQNQKMLNIKLKLSVTYLCKTLIPDISYEQIGESMGGFNHATVLNAWKKAQDLYDTDPVIKRQLNDLVSIFCGMPSSLHVSEFHRAISERYFYLNLNKIKVLKISKNSFVIYSGVPDTMMRDWKDKNFPNDNVLIKEFNNTGLSLLTKSPR